MRSTVATATPAVGSKSFTDNAARAFLFLGLASTSITAFRPVSGLTLGDILLLASLVFACVSRLSEGRRSHLPPSFFGVAVALLVVVGGTLSSFDSSSGSESMLVLARILLVLLVIPWQMRHLLVDRADLERAVGWFVLGGAICGAGTLLQARFGADIIPGASVTNAGRFTGFAQHVSDTGGITSVTIVLALGLLVGAQRRATRLGAIVALAAGATGLILSGSVSGMIAVAGGVLVLLLRRTLRLRYLFVLAAIAALIVAVVSSIQAATSGALSPIERFQQTLGLTAGGRYATSDVRAETYEVAIRRFLESPLIGSGLDGASSIADGRFPAHNILIAAAFQGGILMLIAVVAVIGRSFAGRWVRKDRSVLASTVLAAGVGAIIFAMTAPSLYNRYFWIPIAFMLVARYLPKPLLDESASLAQQQPASKPKDRTRRSRAGQRR